MDKFEIPEIYVRNFPSFRDYDGKNQSKPFGWDFRHPKPGGKSQRLRPTFKTKGEKAEYLRLYKKKFSLFLPLLVSFDEDLYRSAVRAAEILGSDKLEDFARDYVEAIGKASTVTVQEIYDSFIEYLEKTGNKGLTHAKTQARRFVDFVGPSTKASSITRTDCQGFADYRCEFIVPRTGELMGATTVRNHVKWAQQIFNHAINKLEVLHKNPANNLVLPKGEKLIPVTMDVADIKKLFEKNEKRGSFFLRPYGSVFLGRYSRVNGLPRRWRRARRYNEWLGNSLRF